MTVFPEAAVHTQIDSVPIHEKYSLLRQTIVNLYDERVWFLTDAALSVVVSCLLEDATNPVALIFADGPSTEKTTVIDFFERLPYTYRVDKFTPASFLTQSGNVAAKKLKDVDLLPKIVYKTVLIPEMGPTFNQPKEILLENYATLGRVLDGSGLVTAGAVHGQRSLTGDYMFGLLGATTPISKEAWNTMSKIGSRLLFLNAPARLSRTHRQSRSKAILTGTIHYKTKKRMAKDALQDFLTSLFIHYQPIEYRVPDEAPGHLVSQQAIYDHCGYLPRSVEWDNSNYDERTIDSMSLLADFITAARSDIRVWQERGEEGRGEMNSTSAVTEGVDRFTAVLNNLARGHALLSGRSMLTSEDMPLIVSVAMSSLPDNRRRVLELCFDQSLPEKKSGLGIVNTAEIEANLSVSKPTARKIMVELEILGLGKIVNNGSGRQFELDQDFEWFLTDDFYQHYRSWDQRV